MWHTAKWEWHLHYKRIQAYHTHTQSVPSRWIVFTLAVERSTEPLVRDCSYFSLIAVSLSPPSLTSLIEHHSHMLRFHASSFTLTLFLSISVSFSFTYSPVIMPHPPLSLSSPLPVCFRLHISSSNWLFSVPAELHLTVFGHLDAGRWVFFTLQLTHLDCFRFCPGVSGIHRSSGLQPSRVPESVA